MAKATLVVMAAGIGSRFGGGIKQLEPVGPNGEIIMDYSIYDAMEAGFDKVVFVIRKDLEKDFKEVIGNRIEKVVEVAYAYQEISDIPKKFQEKYADRKKPWGTGQAILCCKDVVNEPFLVINADDYYGKEAYKVAYEHLMQEAKESDKTQICMVGFVLGNTLSDNGSVTRGICKADENHMLTDIVETKNIVKTESGAAIQIEEGEVPVDVNSLVSMNMWGLQPEFFEILETGFVEFLEESTGNYEKAEYLLPTIVGNLLHGGKADVRVLKSHDQWFGVTYKEDKEFVVESVKALVVAGEYPEKLYG
ncbi:MAG: nucleotidyltransferase [Tyzzerella sp.]|nr:nucleotidyltransferase [Tyzzerella sp.]